MLKIEKNLKILEEFEKYLIESKKSENTIKAYVKDIKNFIYFLSPKKINELKLSDLQNYKKIIENENQASKTLSRKLNSISKFCKFLVREKYLSENPFKKNLYPETIDRKIRFLSKEEAKEVYLASKELNDKTYILVSLMLLGGLKIGEVQRLTVGDVRLDLKDGKIRISSNDKFERDVPLCEKLFFILSNYIHSNNLLKNLNKPLIRTSTERNFNVRNLRSLVDKVFIQTKIFGYSTNDLRNTFIINQLIAGNSPEFVAEIAGLTSKISIKTYHDLVKDYKQNKKDIVVDIV